MLTYFILSTIVACFAALLLYDIYRT